MFQWFSFAPSTNWGKSQTAFPRTQSNFESDFNYICRLLVYVGRYVDFYLIIIDCYCFITFIVLDILRTFYVYAEIIPLENCLLVQETSVIRPWNYKSSFFFFLAPELWWDQLFVSPFAQLIFSFMLVLAVIKICPMSIGWLPWLTNHNWTCQYFV